jgi:predicted transposase/invertase (TIGR01784 family)
LDKGIEYQGLKPVYALSLINEIFDQESSSFYHHYRLVHSEDHTKILEGLELIFIEIPKFKLKNPTDLKLFVLWMRYMSEIENGQEMINQELLADLKSVPEIEQALELTKESAYTKAELEAYDKYWDNIRTEKTLIVDAEAKGIAQGRQEGEQKKEIEVVLKGYENGLTIVLLSNITGLTENEVIKILTDHGKIS